jgi:hypothetical protein
MNTVPASVRTAIDAELTAAREARRVPDTAWHHLERAHVLSQPWAWPHTQTHLAMLKQAVRGRDPKEITGQLLRVAVGGPGSLLGRYPVGNTGRARVAIMAQQPMESDLVEILRPYVAVLEK